MLENLEVAIWTGKRTGKQMLLHFLKKGKKKVKKKGKKELMDLEKSPASQSEQAFSLSSVFYGMVTWELCLAGIHHMLPPDFWFRAYCSVHLQFSLDALKINVLATLQLCSDRYLPGHPGRDPVTSGLPQRWHMNLPARPKGCRPGLSPTPVSISLPYI